MQSKEKLKTGLTVLCEDIPYVKSVSLGLLIKSGSRHERLSNNGISHMLEHMSFKGTSSLSARKLAEAFDLLGAYLDAFTGREYTCFLFRMTSDKLPRVMELLSDMILNSVFAEEEIEKEKNVILEEIKMYMDQPDDVAMNLFMSGLFDGHAIGRPILGSSETVRSFDRKAVAGHGLQKYVPGNALLCAAGDVDASKFSALAGGCFSGWKGGALASPQEAPAFNFQSITENKELEQAHVLIGAEGLKFSDSRYYALALLNDILGGSVSSRLFQEVREKRGLAYSIQSFSESYAETGVFAVYAGTNPDKRKELVEVVLSEIDKLKKDGPDDKELLRAKEQAKSGLILGLESTSNRMTRMLRQELYFGRFTGLETTVESIEKVSRGDIAALARALFAEGRIKTVVYGPKSSS